MGSCLPTWASGYRSQAYPVWWGLSEAVPARGAALGAVTEGVADQLLHVLLRVAGFPHGADGVEQAVKCFAMAGHEPECSGRGDLRTTGWSHHIVGARSPVGCAGRGRGSAPWGAARVGRRGA